jgi:hypothetical protein
MLTSTSDHIASIAAPDAQNVRWYTPGPTGVEGGVRKSPYAVAIIRPTVGLYTLVREYDEVGMNITAPFVVT